MGHPDKKVSKEISKLKDFIDQMDLTTSTTYSTQKT
jgi:hypothetical protein